MCLLTFFIFLITFRRDPFWLIFISAYVHDRNDELLHFLIGFMAYNSSIPEQLCFSIWNITVLKLK